MKERNLGKEPKVPFEPPTRMGLVFGGLQKLVRTSSTKPQKPVPP